jgi:glycosyltransferase involved in cell wall biosynthesis
MNIGIVAPLDPRTGISTYSGILALELSKLGEDVTIISPKISTEDMPYGHEDLNIISPIDYDVNNYDITHFQLANSTLHEFQLHLLEDHQEQLKNNANIITTVHDARNFDSFNLKCSKCISFGLHYTKTPLMYPYNIVDMGFQRISKYMIFHNKSAMNEYKTRYKLDNSSVKCIPISAYRNTSSKPINWVETDLNDNRLLVPGYISPFKGQDIILEAVNKIDHDLKLVFMGRIVDDEYGKYLHRIIVKEGMEDRVEFLGFVSDDEFIEEMDKAKLVLVPRLISSWLKERPIYKFRKLLGLDYLISHSSSAVLTMALASGKPIICSKNQGFSEYVNSSRGILCNDNVESWRNAINYLLENPDQTREMSLNSKKFANNSISPEMIAKRHINLYQECL